MSEILPFALAVCGIAALCYGGPALLGLALSGFRQSKGLGWVTLILAISLAVVLVVAIYPLA